MAIPLPGMNPVQSAAAASAAAQGSARPSSGPNAAFESLLEDLDSRTRSLERASDPRLGAEGLPAAVEDARTTLAQALELKEALLEAWRAARIGSDGAAA